MRICSDVSNVKVGDVVTFSGVAFWVDADEPFRVDADVASTERTGSMQWKSKEASGETEMGFGGGYGVQGTATCSSSLHVTTFKEQQLHRCAMK